jgi:hypothetical protein
MAKAGDPPTAATAAAETVVRPVPLSGRRRAAIWILVVFASLLGLVSIMATWADRQLLDDQAWQRASTQVIQDSTVRAALSAYVVNQLYDNLDVEGQLEHRLPPSLERLAGPLASTLRQSAIDGVDVLLARPRVERLWITAAATAHEKLVNVLEDKTGFGISTGDGAVTIDLGALVRQLGAELGLPAAALAKLPPDAGVITVMRSSQLSLAQEAVSVIRVLSAWLLLLVLSLYAVAILLARCIRRETVRNIGWALVLVGLLVLVARSSAGSYVVSGLAPAPYRVPAHHIWLIETSILGQIGAATILYGAVTIVGAVLAGPTAAATAVRAAIAPVLARRPGVAWAGLAVVYLLLVLWGGTHALRTWWGILLLGGLLAAGVAVLSRQTLRELRAAGANDERSHAERLGLS